MSARAVDASFQDLIAPAVARVEGLLALRMRGLEDSVPPRLLEAMRYSLLAGGKRLRPVLCLSFAEATARASLGTTHPAEDAACALEYIHTYSLIHDDLPAMDDDDLRRGRPTNHKVYGEAMAILAGDGLLTEAFGLVARGAEPVRQRLVVELALAAGAAGMVGGQVLDTAQDRAETEAYLLRMHRLKTGALIRAACRMGVVSAGGSPEVLAAADIYGDAVGLAFQIADDNLDLTADPTTLGKPTGADAAAGRFTFPSLLGLEGSQRLAQHHVDRALEALAGWGDGAETLRALARYTVERGT